MSLTTPVTGTTHAFSPPISEAPKKGHEIKVASVFERIKNSPLFLTVSAAIALAAVTIVALTVPPVGIPVLAIGIIAGGALLGIGGTVVAMRKRLIYEGSLAYNCLRHRLNPEKWPKCDEITDHIYLGRLPTKNDDDHVKFPQDLGIGAVLSMVEHFENHTLGLLSDPVTPEDWKSLEIDHHQIEAKDFHPLTNEEISEGVKFLEEKVEKGKKVYVHCKAGRSRSAAIVVAYLVKNKKCENVRDAIQFLKEKRPVVKLSEDKVRAIEAYIY